MKKRVTPYSIIILSFVLMISLIACKSTITNDMENNSGYSYYSGLQSVTLVVNEEIIIDGIKLQLLGVESDSRCPKGVNCAEIGIGKVKIKISDSLMNEASEEYTLSVYGGVTLPDYFQPSWKIQMNIKEWKSGTIFFAGLNPYPTHENNTNHATDSAQYTAVFFIESKQRKELREQLLQMASEELVPPDAPDGPIFTLLEMYPININDNKWILIYQAGNNPKNKIKLTVDSEKLKIIKREES